MASSTRSCVRRVATRFTSITNISTRTTYTPSTDMRTSSGVTYESVDTVDMDLIHIIMEHVAGRCTCRLAASTHCSLGHCTICIGLRMSSCVCLHIYLNVFYICLPSFPSLPFILPSYHHTSTRVCTTPLIPSNPPSLHLREE